MDIPKSTEKRTSKNELMLKAEDFPIVIEYGDKRYVIILTRNDKLILQKTIE